MQYLLLKIYRKKLCDILGKKEKKKEKKQRKWKDQWLPEPGAGDCKEISRWNTHKF